MVLIGPKFLITPVMISNLCGFPQIHKSVTTPVMISYPIGFPRTLRFLITPVMNSNLCSFPQIHKFVITPVMILSGPKRLKVKWFLSGPNWS